MTEEDLRWLRGYARDHAWTYRQRSSNGWWRVLDLTDQQLREVVGTARTRESMYQRARAWIRAQETAEFNRPAPDRAATQRVPKMTTKEYRTRLRDLSDVAKGPRGRLMCWEAALDAFGVTARTGKGEYPHIYHRHLEADGWEVTKVEKAALAPAGVTPTLAVFMAAHPTGSWLIETNSHVIAVRDGVITDTEGQRDVRRRVENAHEVTRKPRPVPPVRVPGGVVWPVPCNCQSPEVFGHGAGCSAHLGGWKMDGYQMW